MCIKNNLKKHSANPGLLSSQIQPLQFPLLVIQMIFLHQDKHPGVSLNCFVFHLSVRDCVATARRSFAGNRVGGEKKLKISKEFRIMEAWGLLPLASLLFQDVSDFQESRAL